VISGFCHEVDEKYAPLGCNTPCSGNFLLTCQDNFPVLKGQESKSLDFDPLRWDR